MYFDRVMSLKLNAPTTLSIPLATHPPYHEELVGFPTHDTGKTAPHEIHVTDLL